MFEISVEAYPEKCIHTIAVHKKHNKTVLWIKMFDIQDKLGVKNMSDLVRKEIMGICNTKTPTKEQKRQANEKVKEFRTKLGFKQHHITLTKEQSVTPKIIEAFSNEKI